jgi:hypothetical protein
VLVGNVWEAWRRVRRFPGRAAGRVTLAQRA